MSLVNDMLKDLEARKREPLPAGVSLEQAKSANDRARLILLSALVLLIAIVPAAFYLGASWQGSTSQVAKPADLADTSATPEETAISDMLMTAEDSADETSADGQLAVDQPDVADAPLAKLAEPGTAGERPADESEKIAGLLDSADSALRNDRLTSPIDDNAFTRYQAVLFLEPEHPEALQGIRKIAERYVEFYGNRMQSGDRRIANSYLERAERVVSRYPQLAAWLDERVSRELASVARGAAQVTAADSEKTAAGESGEHVTQAASTDERPSVRKAPSQTELDRRAASQAHKLLRQGRTAQARRVLLAHLDENPQAPLTRKALFDIYLDSGDRVAAEEQLERLDGLARHEQAHMRARLAVQEGNIPAAIMEMEAVAPSVRDDPAYHSYLAALYHKAERFVDAARVYERLTETERAQATYWLGLAVSLDALDDRSGALQAFRNAHRYSKADSASRAYVEERIRALSG